MRAIKSSSALRAMLVVLPAVLVVLVSFTSVLGQSIPVNPPVSQANRLDQVVLPMEIDVTSLNIVRDSSGQNVVVVNLNAHNNLGIEPTYASARVQLQSLNLTFNYTYQPIAGATQAGVIIVKPNPSIVLTPNQRLSFTVNVIGLPQGSGTLTAYVFGGYTWSLQSSDGIIDIRNIIVNGQGRIADFSQSLVVQA